MICGVHFKTHPLFVMLWGIKFFCLLVLPVVTFYTLLIMKFSGNYWCCFITFRTLEI